MTSRRPRKPPAGSAQPGSEPSDAIELDGAIGRAIREARKKAGLTTTVLAQQAGVSQAFLSHLETGRSTPSIATLYRLAAALKIAPQDLLPGPANRDLVVTRRVDGLRLPGADRALAGGLFRLLAGEATRMIKAHEVTAEPGSPTGDWFEHPGEDLVFVIAGTLEVEFGDWQRLRLDAGDAAWWIGTQRHCFHFPGDLRTQLILVTAHGSGLHET